ncbi:hypothetical protein [Enterococcus faecalis]|nr:hypothetical protein [Enterococcus faecalis]
MKKTKKEYTPYNDYVDRPFDLKWPSAFPLGVHHATVQKRIIKKRTVNIN